MRWRGSKKPLLYWGHRTAWLGVQFWGEESFHWTPASEFWFRRMRPQGKERVLQLLGMLRRVLMEESRWYVDAGGVLGRSARVVDREGTVWSPTGIGKKRTAEILKDGGIYVEGRRL